MDVSLKNPALLAAGFSGSIDSSVIVDNSSVVFGFSTSLLSKNHRKYLDLIEETSE